MKTLCAQDVRKIDDVKYLFTKCEKLTDIQNKYNINDPNEVFNEVLSKERIIKIAKFINETETEKKMVKWRGCLWIT